MIKKLALIPCLLLANVESFANCTPNAPEIGDVGPSSELVCRELERLFPGAQTAVEDRTILSPSAVAVFQVSVDGESMLLPYDRVGFVWTPTAHQDGLAVIGRETRPK